VNLTIKELNDGGNVQVAIFYDNARTIESREKDIITIEKNGSHSVTNRDGKSISRLVLSAKDPSNSFLIGTDITFGAGGQGDIYLAR